VSSKPTRPTLFENSIKNEFAKWLEEVEVMFLLPI